MQSTDAPWRPGLGFGRTPLTALRTIVATDLGQVFDCTSGTFTVTLSAPATLKSGFCCTVYNSGTGLITVAPASGTLRLPRGTVSSFVLHQGQGLSIECDGTGFSAIITTSLAADFCVKADFGAVGDGITDDSAAIQAADTAIAALGGGVLRFAAGTYLCGTKLVHNSTVTWVGDSYLTTIIKLKDGTNDNLVVDYNWENNITNTSNPFLMRDLTLDGNRAANTSGSGLTFQAFRSRFIRVFFQNFAEDGCVLTVQTKNGTPIGQGVADNRFDTCVFKANMKRGLYGLDNSLNKLADCEFIGCTWHLNGDSGYDQVEVERAAGFTWTDCRWYNGFKNDINITKLGRGQIFGCNFDLDARQAANTGQTYASIVLGVNSTHDSFVIGGNTFYCTPVTSTATDIYCAIYATSQQNHLNLTGNAFRVNGPTNKFVFNNLGSLVTVGTAAGNSFVGYTLPTELGTGYAALMKSSLMNRQYIYCGDGTTYSNDTVITPSEANDNARLFLAPNGTGALSQFFAFASSDVDNSNYGGIEAATTYVALRSEARGTGVAQQLRLIVNGAVSCFTSDVLFTFSLPARSTDTSDATSAGAGSIRTAGGIAAAKSIYADGNFTAGTAGKGLVVKEGSNAKQGVVTLVAGASVVSNTSVTASSRIMLTTQSLGTVTAPKAIAVTARVLGASFTITSADATDTSVVAYEIFEAAP